MTMSLFGNAGTASNLFGGAKPAGTTSLFGNSAATTTGELSLMKVIVKWSRDIDHQ